MWIDRERKLPVSAVLMNCGESLLLAIEDLNVHRTVMQVCLLMGLSQVSVRLEVLVFSEDSM